MAIPDERIASDSDEETLPVPSLPVEPSTEATHSLEDKPNLTSISTFNYYYSVAERIALNREAALRKRRELELKRAREQGIIQEHIDSPKKNDSPKIDINNIQEDNEVKETQENITQENVTQENVTQEKLTQEPSKKLKRLKKIDDSDDESTTVNTQDNVEEKVKETQEASKKLRRLKKMDDSDEEPISVNTTKLFFVFINFIDPLNISDLLEFQMTTKFN